MDAALAIKGVSYGLVALLAVTLLALSLLSLRKEIQTGQSLIGLFPLALIITALCTVIALYAAYLRLNRARATMLHLERTALTLDESVFDSNRRRDGGQAL